MKPRQVYSKTMKFVWMKLALGLGAVLVSAVLAAIIFGISIATGGETIGIALVIWLCLSLCILGVLQHFIGYVFKAGHVAAVTEIVTSGNVPDDPFAYGTDVVKKKFPTAAAYFAVDSLTGGAVKQINKGLDVVGNILGKVPGMEKIIDFAQHFVNIALGNVDECCLAYTFYKEDQSAFKSAADGVVIYFQNWKVILKSALKLAFMVLVITTVAGIVLTLVLLGVVMAFGLPGYSAFFIAIVIAMMLIISVKSAFLDSYTMVSMLCSYMEVAPSTEITFDLYGKLCKLSAKFRSLFDKGQAETGTVA